MRKSLSAAIGSFFMLTSAILPPVALAEDANADVTRAAIDAAIAEPVPSACRVSLPKGGGAYGNTHLQVILPTQSKFIFAPGRRQVGFAAASDGAMGMKVGWIVRIPEMLSISGHRLDGEAAPLRAFIPEGLIREREGESTALLFPTPGCWQVTGKAGRASIKFVVWVIKIGDGPTERRDI